MWIKYTLTIIGGIVFLIIMFIWISGYRLKKSTRQLFLELNAHADTSYGRTFNSQDLNGLPAPVQRYLKNAIPEGQPHINFVELKQIGSFRMNEDSEKWQPLKATQHFTTNPPGFVWDAKIKMAPLITARVLDMYKQATGILKAKLFNTFTVVDASGAKELDTGELIRYLAETVWFPTALLPSQSLKWEAIDNNTAIAMLKDGDNEVSVKFYFNNEDKIIKSISQRYRLVNGMYQITSWTGYYSDYQRRNGILIPLEGKVEWNLLQGNFEYWKGRIVDIKYNPEKR